ncbi:MAG: 23S rRNA (adenine(2503)-C(2))-methyltransferase RlmN [Planctomycetes bacterium]|nr:23S rRNA (adenine(2503)-C(2))-methyltransferase RlmN [Planctomycetota bacterium]
MSTPPTKPQYVPQAPKTVSMMNEDDLAAFFKSQGEPAFRATQLREFVFRKGVASYDQVTNLSKALRARLAEIAPMYDLSFVRTSAGDDAVKWLWRARDGALIESVQIRVPGRLTSCLSSQVGCAMGCVFCATGLSGFERHLECHEIIEQYLQMWGRSGEHSTHVVFMGMGEPLHNYDEVMAAVQTLNAPPPRGCGIGARRITISTVGIVPGIEKLAKDKRPVELAISLHAPDDATRERLIPVTNRYPVADVMKAAREYSRRTGRFVTYEYVMLAGVNDNEAQARELGALLKGLPCKVNLIPFNAVEGSGFERPSIEAQQKFQKVIEDYQVSCTIRFSKGKGVDAACGQLRRQKLASGSQPPH